MIGIYSFKRDCEIILGDHLRQFLVDQCIGYLFVSAVREWYIMTSGMTAEDFVYLRLPAVLCCENFLSF
jgi:hypothetical protein